jgi:hypothetical protein
MKLHTHTKAFSAFYSIFRNELRVTMKFEEEYQKIIANNELVSQNNKEKLSFIDKNIVICEASFLNLWGYNKTFFENNEIPKFFRFFQWRSPVDKHSWSSLETMCINQGIALQISNSGYFLWWNEWYINWYIYIIQKEKL